MNAKQAKKLRRASEVETTGMSKHLTRKMYKKIKTVHKSLNKNEK